MAKHENSISVLWKKSYNPKSVKLTKKAENLKGWTVCKLADNVHLDLQEYLALAFGESVKVNNGKVALKDLPVWKDIEAFCLDSMLATLSAEEGGSGASLYWTIEASHSGKTWWLVGKSTETASIPVTFKEPEKKEPKNEATTEATETEVSTKTTETEVVDTLMEDATNLLAQLKAMGKLADAVAFLKDIAEGAEIEVA